MIKKKYTSRGNFIENKSVDKRILSQIVRKRLNNGIKYLDVASVVNILFEELFLELINNGKVFIENFGSFIFKCLSPRRHYNFYTKQFEISNGKKIIRFELDKKIQVNLKDNLDIEKTFKEPDNG